MRYYIIIGNDYIKLNEEEYRFLFTAFASYTSKIESVQLTNGVKVNFTSEENNANITLKAYK